MTEVVKTYRFRQFIEEMDKETPAFNNSKTKQYDASFCRESWDKALELSRYGIKNQKKIENIVAKMSMLEVVKTKCFSMSETGLCVDVGTYLNGEPECWISENFDYRPKKVVKLLVNCTQSWQYTTNQIEIRGAGLVSLIQMLKKQGYIVKLNLYMGFNYFGKHYFCFLKIPSNPLDIQSLSYCLCSPSLLRRFGFAFLEQCTNKSDCGGYGTPYPLDEVVMSKDIIHFNGMNNEECKYQDEAETKLYIMDTFTKFLELNHEKANI